VGHNVSHANNRTRKVQMPNVQKKRIYVPEEGRFVTISVSTRALRTIDKMGLKAYAHKLGIDIKDLMC
jgi:large subunit ribosomal protein L28